jgi:hypothetical protein
VPGPECCPFLMNPPFRSLLMPMPQGFPAYVGLGPEQAFIPYFLALLAWVCSALIAVFQWPIAALVRRWRGTKTELQKEEMKSETTETAAVETNRAGSPNKP